MTRDTPPEQGTGRTPSTTPTRGAGSRPTHPIDDDAIAQLVRDVAEGWVMPPVHLDQSAWRDRIRGPRSRRAAAVRGWFGRLGQAATAALALTVGAAVLAVWLTGPRGNVGKSPEPSTGGSPRPTAAARSSQLPKLLVQGDLPSPSDVIVQLDGGGFALVDLATGTIGGQVTGTSYGSQVRRASDGTLVCLCVAQDTFVQAQNTHATVSLYRFDGAGKVISRDTVLDVTGVPDPRDGGIPEQPGHLATWSTFSADGRYGYVGWSARAHPVWHSGFAVVDLSDGTVIQRVALPDRSTGTGDHRAFVDAPRIVGWAGDRAVINRSSYSWSPAGSTRPDYVFGTDVYTAISAAGALGKVQPLVVGTDCGNDVNLAGGLPDGGTWLSCRRGGALVVTVIRRIRADGTLIADGTFSTAGIDGATSAASPDGSAMFLWNPLSLTLTRVDLATGNVTTGRAPSSAASSDGPLEALGRWLAPAAAAKVLLQSGIAISPDGQRVYAIGIHESQSGSEIGGSAGLFVFDSSSLGFVGHWDPTADFMSVAVSGDGTFVFAAGAAGVDADGKESDQPASVTVFNAADGTVRLVAGQLGSAAIWFTGATLR
jgi:hypothetical protein